MTRTTTPTTTGYEVEIGPRLLRVYAEAYAWIMDCEWADGPFEPGDLTFAQVKCGIEKHYEGGWDAFVLACEDLD